MQHKFVGFERFDADVCQFLEINDLKPDHPFIQEFLRQGNDLNDFTEEQLERRYEEWRNKQVWTAWDSYLRLGEPK